MQRLIYIIFISFFLLVSCAKQKPKGILSESKMTELLTEVTLVDSYLNMLPIDSGRKVMPVLYDNLFKQFDIDSMLFEKNLQFYYGNPKLTESIYAKIDSKLKESENKYRIEDSIRNAFVSDSIRRVSRIQSLDAERRDLTLNYYRGADESLNYKDYAYTMFGKIDLGIRAYGLHIPAIPSSNRVIIPEEPIMQDSVLRRYLDKPIQQFLLEAKKDSTSIDYRILNILFLKNSNLNVRTGYTYRPVMKAASVNPSVAQRDSLNQNILAKDSLKEETPK